jgi:hypothetical protein
MTRILRSVVLPVDILQEGHRVLVFVYHRDQGNGIAFHFDDRVDDVLFSFVNFAFRVEVSC